MMSSAYKLPEKTIVIWWEGGHSYMRVLLHLAMPRMTKDEAAKIFATLRRFLHADPRNESLPREIHEWFYIATDASLQTWRQANRAYQDEHRATAGRPKVERNKIGANNTRLERELKTAKRVNDRLEDRLHLFETMFKGML